MSVSPASIFTNSGETRDQARDLCSISGSETGCADCHRCLAGRCGIGILSRSSDAL